MEQGDNWLPEGMKPEVIIVSDEAFDELLRMLEEPPKIIPEIVELFRRERRIKPDAERPPHEEGGRS